MTAHSNALLCLCLIAGCTTATKEENTAGPKPDAEEPASEPSQRRTFRPGKTCGAEMTALKHSISELEGGVRIVSKQSKDLLAQASEGLHTKKAAVRVKLLAVPLENLSYSCRQTFLSLEERFRNIRIPVESIGVPSFGSSSAKSNSGSDKPSRGLAEQHACAESCRQINERSKRIQCVYRCIPN